MINYVDLVINNPGYYRQFSCKDLLFLNYDCPVKLKKVAKWSDRNYIYYVVTGKKTLHTIDNSITLTGGSIAFIKKGACIAEQYFDDPFCVVVFIMPDAFILSFLKDYGVGEKASLTETSPIIPLQDDHLTQHFYQSIIPYFATADNIPEQVLELKFRELLLYLLHNPANEELRSYFLSLKEERNTLQETMENNYAYNLGIEEFARITNRSVSTFKREFQAIYKTTPGKWLMEKKLTHAKKLLIETDDPISSVAFDSGFENTAHFSRLFKQKTGVTPLEYRKKSLVTA
jgi:AraC-like DNA-binding protein